MTLGAWFHTIDPTALHITDAIQIRWYGLSYVLAFLIGWLVLRRLADRRLIAIPKERAGDAILLLMVGVLVGGRLGYVLLYEPSLMWSFDSSPPWWGLLATNRGGMASHGGMIGVVLACLAIARGWRGPEQERIGRCSPLHVMDAMALVAPIGLFLGRIANFVNGELLGRIVAMPGQPAPWWAVRFPQEVLSGHEPNLSPEQQEALYQVVSPWMSQGLSFQSAYQRVLDAIHRGSPELVRQLEPLISARHPSQLYQAFAEGIVLGSVLWWIWRKPRVPGVIGAWFLIVYGVLRIATEFWRLPDAHLAVQRPMGMSRG